MADVETAVSRGEVVRMLRWWGRLKVSKTFWAAWGSVECMVSLSRRGTRWVTPRMLMIEVRKRVYELCYLARSPVLRAPCRRLCRSFSSYSGSVVLVFLVIGHQFTLLWSSISRSFVVQAIISSNNKVSNWCSLNSFFFLLKTKHFQPRNSCLATVFFNL